MVVGCLLTAVVACKPKTPRQYIQPDDMEDILVDYHVAKAMAMQSVRHDMTRSYQTALYIDAVLAKYGVSKAQFDSSLVYYYTRADRFEPIYKRVSERLEEQALTYGANDSEIGKYANATGDTANIWSGRTATLMLPHPPYNRWDFELQGDSLFKRGDSFLMQFVSDYMYQNSGARNGILYVAVEYNDTTICKQSRFSSSTLNRLDIPARDDKDIKSIRGFFYLNTDDAPAVTSARLLFLNNVQLIRFHKKEDETKKNSLPPADAGGPLPADSLSLGDSLRRGDQMVSAER